MSRHRAISQSHLILASLRRSTTAVLQCVPNRKASRSKDPNAKPVSKELIHESIPPEIRRRRIALQACGLLEQSRMYGDSRLYDVGDQDHESSALSAANIAGKGKEDVNVQVLAINPNKDALPSGRSAISPAPPYSPLTPYSAPSPSSETKPFSEDKPDAHRIRRIASIVDEIDSIADEESRRLTEVAYLC